MTATPKGFRLHIGLFGRRNVGKSSVLNAMTRQSVSIVSSVAGTTTDPVEKPMELLPLGPVLFIDTAGIDDLGSLGEKRIQKTRQAFDRTDVGVIVAPAGEWTEFEEDILQELEKREVPVIVIFNKCDLASPDANLVERLHAKKIRTVMMVASEGGGVLDLREAFLQTAPEDFVNAPAIVGDLLNPGDLAVLVVPIDMEAPKGRIILPQVQTIRDILDADCSCIMLKENELKKTFARLKEPPAIVITDSQAFAQVSADTPESVPLTSFSILFARNKGSLPEFVRGTMSIKDLQPGDRVLVAESCTHHPIGDDIGRVKIPAWLRKHVGGELRFDTVQGHDFPDDLSPYKMVIHCGSCMWNRREMLSRQLHCRKSGVGISNYGLTIAYLHGIFERALQPFPESLKVYHEMNDAAGV